jgi:hypothetical protein
MIAPEYLIMADAGFKSKKEILRGVFDFIFGFENKKGEVLDHWIAFHDNLSFPPEEFYGVLSKELAARKIPSMEISREEFSEGGLVADKRIYLRFFRERLALYTCAAPFGCGYFFSCRTVYVPALVRLWHIVVVLSVLAIIARIFLPLLGFTFTIYAMIALVFALGRVFKNAAAKSISDIDTLLLKIPAISTIYENWFRAESFYRTDTRTIYLQRIPALVKEIAEEITAAKGAKLVQQFRFAPILGELYKPVAPSPTLG